MSCLGEGSDPDALNPSPVSTPDSASYSSLDQASSSGHDSGLDSGLYPSIHPASAPNQDSGQDSGPHFSSDSWSCIHNSHPLSRQDCTFFGFPFYG